METSFLWFGVFSGSFGVRSIVLCKCSDKYIDIYFKLKITYPELDGNNKGTANASVESTKFKEFCTVTPLIKNIFTFTQMALTIP